MGKDADNNYEQLEKAHFVDRWHEMTLGEKYILVRWVVHDAIKNAFTRLKNLFWVA